VACSWVLRSMPNCSAPNPCNCAYAPSFTTTGTSDTIYDCLDASGAACPLGPSGCAGANPSVMGASCLLSCNQSMNCPGGSNPGGDPGCSVSCCGPSCPGVIICNWPGIPGCFPPDHVGSGHGCYSCP
jgi:hypothetical protein